MANFDSLIAAATPRVHGILRIIIGFLFTAHGTQKVLNYPASPNGAADLFSFMGFAGALELIGGLLIMVGLFTRITAFILSGMMAVAYFMVHAPQGFLPIVNKGELAVLYSFVFLFLSAAGAGAYSLDGLLSRRVSVASSPQPAADAI
jgi:putative oxidoreductase